MTKTIVVFLLILVVTACDGLKAPEQNTVYYYDLDSLLNEQKELLKNREISLEKWAYVDGDTSSNTYIPDTAQWDDELAFFNKMNINKPVLQGVYKTEVVPDTKSNLTIKQFIPNDPSRDIEVQFLKVYYLDDIKNIKKVEARYNEDNPIYKSARSLTLLFDDITGQALLKSFKVKGGQKMILKDSVQFEVVGTIKRQK